MFWYFILKGGIVVFWVDSYVKVFKMVLKMILVEKVNVIIGMGWEMGLVVGMNVLVIYVGFL